MKRVKIVDDNDYVPTSTEATYVLKLLLLLGWPRLKINMFVLKTAMTKHYFILH